MPGVNKEGINMSNHTNTLVTRESMQLDQLTLWLNFENKMDGLRSRFLAIASILFTLQSGAFALMLDKVFFNSFQCLSAEILLIILSLLVLIFLLFVYVMYSSHIDSNKLRSDFVAAQSHAIKQFKYHVGKYLQQKLPKHKEKSLKDILYQVLFIYGILFLLTVGMPLLHII